jgi:hypothetical protein
MPTGNPRFRARRRGSAAALVIAGALALAACHHAPPPPSNATPEQAVATSLRLAATGDFDGLMKNRLPPADYALWRSEWDRSHAHAEPPSAARQQQFAQIMRMLTEPGAEAKLAKRLQPELAKLHGGKDSSLHILGGILRAAGEATITDSPQLDAAQKMLARQALAVLIGWAKTTDFSDPKKADKAIQLVCNTARQLHVQTLSQWRALDYARTMRDYGILWNGLEDVLNLYGLDLANSLTTAKVGTITNDGSHATVKLDITFVGQPLSGEWPMVKQAGHWYDAAVLAAWQKDHPAPATTAAGPAAGGTTPSPAASTAPAVEPTAPPSSAKPDLAAPASSAPAGSGRD